MRRNPTVSERLLRRALKEASGSRYRWQFQSVVLGWILDFYCSKARVAVEVDGSSHEGREHQDQNRDAVLRDRLDILTLRFSNEAVQANPDKVADAILRFCDSRPAKRWNEGRKKNGHRSK